MPELNQFRVESGLLFGSAIDGDLKFLIITLQVCVMFPFFLEFCEAAGLELHYQRPNGEKFTFQHDPLAFSLFFDLPLEINL